MSIIAKLEQTLLSRQLLEAEIDNMISDLPEHSSQLSLYLISGKNLQPSIHSKVHRQLKFTIDGQIFESKLSTCEGLSQKANWNEAFLLPVKSIESCLKLVYVEQETSSKPLGGVIIKMTGLTDQSRHDGWYDIGCGMIRLALRFIYDPALLFEQYLSVISQSVKDTEKEVQKARFVASERRFEDFYLKARVVLLQCMKSLAKEYFKEMEKAGKLGKIRTDEKKGLGKGWESRDDQGEAGLDLEDIGNHEDLDTFLRKLNQEMKENVKVLDKEQTCSFNQSFSDMPPYIEAVEKTCKRRIAIKRY